MYNSEICGKCKHHFCDNANGYSSENKTWYCNNQNSKNYEELTEYEDSCDEYEERE